MSQNYSEPIYLKKGDFDRLFNLVQNLPSKAELLEEELDKAEIIDNPNCFPQKVVSMYSSVLFKDLNSEKERLAILVYPDEADAFNCQISVLSPVGTALLGVKEGDVVTYTAPNQKVVFIKVIKVDESTLRER